MDYAERLLWSYARDALRIYQLYREPVALRLLVIVLDLLEERTRESETPCL